MLKFLRGATPKFLPRSPERDRENDARRFSVVFAALDEVIAGIANESEGLRKRYEAAQNDASMFLYASESEGSSRTMDDRLVYLEKSVVYYETRMKALAAQSETLADLSRISREMLSTAS